MLTDLATSWIRLEACPSFATMRRVLAGTRGSVDRQTASGSRQPRRDGLNHAVQVIKGQKGRREGGGDKQRDDGAAHEDHLALEVSESRRHLYQNRGGREYNHEASGPVRAFWAILRSRARPHRRAPLRARSWCRRGSRTAHET